MAKLKTCPFCGGEAAAGTVKYGARMVQEEEWDQDTFHFVNCTRCGVSNIGMVGHKTPTDAATKWNVRQPQ